MKAKKLRQLYLKHRKGLKEIAIPESEVEVLIFIGGGKTTSHEVSKALQIHVSNASLKLTHLYRKGYLERVKKFADSGGFIYIYNAKWEW